MYLWLCRGFHKARNNVHAASTNPTTIEQVNNVKWTKPLPLPTHLFYSYVSITKYINNFILP